MNDAEPCLCGDPECGLCFPGQPPEPCPDAAYDAERQQELDEGRDRHAP